MSRRASLLTHRVDHYAMRVHERELVAGPLVRLAAERHIKDRMSSLSKAGHRARLFFHEASANHIIDFFEKVLRLPDTLDEDGDPVPFVLTPANTFIVGSLFGWKQASGYRRFREAYIEMGKGNAKALAIDTPIPTPEGWRTMGDLHVGDIVFDERGRPVPIIAESQLAYAHDCFEVVFDDGSTIVADAEHLWFTEQRTFIGDRGASKRGVPRNRRGRWRLGIRTTAEIAATLRYPNGKYQSANHSIPLAGPLGTDFSPLPIPPYVLGAWLGDGDSDAARLTISDADAELLEHVAACGVSVGERRQATTATIRTPRYRIGGTGRSKPGSLNATLRQMGMFARPKHIPGAYLRAAVDQRLALLQGLMDTDGHITPKSGQCTLTTIIKALAEDVRELVVSLGMKCTVRETMARLYGRDISPVWSVSFFPPADVPVFRLRRKALHQRVRHQRRRLSAERRIVDVRPVPSVPVKCIGVDTPSHLYLAGRSMIPTHNTPLAAGMGLYGLTMDGEQAPEIYSVATGIEQARICWRDADRMVEASPDLSELIHRSKDNLAYAATFGWFRPQTKEKRGKSGPRPHMAFFDELHEYADAVVANKVRAGAKRRKQPLFVDITNSGFDRTSICWQHHEHARKVVEGLVEDEQLFSYVCALDKDEDPLTDPACHVKANPNLGVVIQQDYLDRQVMNAQNVPSETNTVLRLNFCVWTQGRTAYFQMANWRACSGMVPDADLIGVPCYGGIDLGQSDDFCAWARLWDLPDGRKVLKLRFWIPEAALKKYPDRPYEQWQRVGVLTVTEGDITDYDLVEEAILDDARTDGVKEIGYDKRFAQQMALHLQGADITMVDTPQGFGLNEALKTFNEWVVACVLLHGGDIVLNWMADNTIVRHGPNQSIRLDKEESKEKIDGISAAVTAAARVIANAGGETESSYADGHGLLIV
jgi:phage terminase large subunit-like protein